MKTYKYLVFPLLAISALIASCSDNSTNEIIEKNPELKEIDKNKIIGEWIESSSNSGSLNRMMLDPDGGFNISKVEKGWNVATTNKKGKWLINNNQITGTYTKISGPEDTTGEPVIVNISLSEQNDYSFKVVSSDKSTTTYKKLLEEINIRKGQTVVPECLSGMQQTTVKTIITPFRVKHETVSSSKIKTMKSMNTSVATVDATSGAITAVANGVTFVDVETTEGVATIKVIVDDDFIGLMGKTRPEIHELYGTDNIMYEDISQVMYNMEGEFKFLKIQFMAGKVYAVAVYSKDDIFVNSDAYKKNFEMNYHVYAKGTSTNYLAYTDKPTLAESQYGIIFDYTQKTSYKISYLDLSKNVLFHDYSAGLGKTKSEIFDMYSTRTDANTPDLVFYELRTGFNDYVKNVGFKFESGKCSSVVVNFQSGASKTEIINWLSSTMNLIRAKNDLYLYHSKDGEVEILYNSTDNGLICKFNSLWENYNTLFGQSKENVKKEMVNSYFANYLLTDYSYSVNGSDYYTFDDSEYASMVGFVFNKKNLMCEYWVYLDLNFDVDAIKKFLARDYIMAQEECTSRQLVYYDESKRFKVIFDASGYIAYIDNNQERHESPSLTSRQAVLPRINK